MFWLVASNLLSPDGSTVVTCPVLGMKILTDVKELHGRVAKVLAANDASLMLGEGIELDLAAMWVNVFSY